MDVEGSSAGYDGEFQRESGEAGVPWSWERAERIPEALVEKLLFVKIMLSCKSQ